jgi:hypothetical protein
MLDFNWAVFWSVLAALIAGKILDSLGVAAFELVLRAFK